MPRNVAAHGPRRRLRRDESQAQTREALMEAAGRLFDDRGFAATSIADIAEEAGYTTGALYSNFSSKDDLFFAVLERQLTMEMAALGEALSREPTMAGRMQIVGRWYASQAGHGRRRTRALAEMALLTRGREDADARLRAQRRRLHLGVRDLLRQQEVELGFTFQLPIPQLAAAVQALLEGFALSSAFDDDTDDIDNTEAVVAALTLLLRPASGDRS